MNDRPISDDREERGRRRTALVSVGAACLLVALKLGAGLATGSLGLVAAGIESSGDVVAAILTVGALRLAGRPADREHPYGHRRAENLAALGEAAILAAGALIIANEAIGRLRGGGGSLEARWYVFAVIGAALCVDASRTVISLRTARRYRSAALRSNAFHFAADFVGSLAVLAGLVLVSAGVQQGDALAALFVSAIILAASGRLVSENAGVLMDRAPAAAEQRAREAIEALGGEVELRRLRVRESAGRVFADAVVAVPPARAVIEGHELADRVEAAVAEALPGADVVVHVEPRKRDLDLRERILATALSDPLVREVHNLTIYEHGPRRSASLHLKLPPELSLAEAHEVAERVERAVAADAGVEVQTHLEPLERPLALQPGAGVPHGALERAVERLARGRGGEARSVRQLGTDAGLVVFVDLALDPNATLAVAHRLASEIEEDLRREQPAIADVVIHTEPLTPERSATERESRRPTGERAAQDGSCEESAQSIESPGAE